MATFLERYLQGEHQQVWSELVALGPAVNAPDVLEDAVGVAHETMRRALQNIQTLIARLTDLGYQFGSPSGDDLTPQVPYQPPLADVQARLQELQTLAGPLPLSLQAWYEVVGEVYLVGTAPWRTGPMLPDALVVDSIATATEGVRAWMEEREDTPLEDWEEPCLAWIAPDEYHKDDISGGPPYGIVLPNAAADAQLENEWHQTSFVEYLRQCFVCGGFPGLSRELGGLPETERLLATGLLPL